MCQALPEDRNEPVVLAEHVGLPGIDPGLCDEGRDVDARVIRVGEQQRHHDGVAPGRREHVLQIGKVLLAERHPDVDIASHPSDGVRHLMCRFRRSRIGTPVRRQDQSRVGLGRIEPSHEACSPHSVFDVPAQRPLRGSAPAIGLAVHGAQPIDG